MRPLIGAMRQHYESWLWKQVKNPGRSWAGYHWAEMHLRTCCHPDYLQGLQTTGPAPAPQKPLFGMTLANQFIQPDAGESIQHSLQILEWSQNSENMKVKGKEYCFPLLRLPPIMLCTALHVVMQAIAPLNSGVARNFFRGWLGFPWPSISLLLATYVCWEGQGGGGGVQPHKPPPVYALPLNIRLSVPRHSEVHKNNVKRKSL